MTEDKEKIRRVYRKLSYYFDNKIFVFFKYLNPSDNKYYFRTGIILDLNEKKSFCILKEKVLGEIPILFEEIVENSIQTYRAKPLEVTA